MRMMGELIVIGKWFYQLSNSKNPITTVFVHILLLILVLYPDLLLPTLFLYLFLIGMLYYEWRARNPPHMDTLPDLDLDLDLARMRNDYMITSMITGTIQTVFADLAIQGERLQSLLSCRNPRATAAFVTFCLVSAIVLNVTPVQVFILVVGFYVFRHKPPFNIQDVGQQQPPKATLPATPNETNPSILVPAQICQRFSLDEIRSATQNFDEALVCGHGGFGKVYKGFLKDDDDSNTNIVAIKMSSSMSNQGSAEFRAEVEMLSKTRHCNLVSLIGYCNEGREMGIVYEYMPEGSLADHLHKTGSPNLSWLQLLKICIGAARGLNYLHTGTGTQHGIIHRDVKSSNVLLDKNFAAKISDFGLAKIGPTNQTRTHVTTMVKGTFGYLDPCYVYTGELTRKSDVYSFGVVLLEVICGRPAVDTSLDEEQWSLAPWAQARIKEGKRNQIIDSRLRGQISSNCLKDFVRVASQCLHKQPNQRPRMAEIIGSLELILSLQERRDSSISVWKLILGLGGKSLAIA